MAYDAPGPGDTALRLFTVAAGARLAYPVRIAGDPEPRVAWSPDGRWLAYADAVDGLTLGAADEARTYPLAADGDFPAWRLGH